MFRLGSTLTWDANVFRLPDSAPDPQAALGKSGKSDRITAVYVGLTFDKLYSQQRVVLEVTETATRYEKFTSLNFDAFKYRGEWQWHLSPRISGTLRADRSESLIGFEDITQGLQRIVRATSNRGVTVDGWLFGGWHLLGGASETESKSTATFFAQPNFAQSTGEIGLRYVAASQSSVTFTRRSRDGTNTGQAVDPVNFIDSGFSVQESEVMATWIASGRSTLNGRLTRIERRHEHIPQRDFSGVAGELRYSWAPTGKLTLDFSALRNVVAWTPDTSTSYRKEDTLAFTPAWRIGEKTRLRMNAYRTTYDYLGPVVPVAGPLRRDVVQSVQFGADWIPHRAVTLSATVQSDRRSSNDPTFNFKDTIASVNLAVKF